jgi:hypothetical protein
MDLNTRPRQLKVESAARYSSPATYEVFMNESFDGSISYGNGSAAVCLLEY